MMERSIRGHTVLTSVLLGLYLMTSSAFAYGTATGLLESGFKQDTATTKRPARVVVRKTSGGEEVRAPARNATRPSTRRPKHHHQRSAHTPGRSGQAPAPAVSLPPDSELLSVCRSYAMAAERQDYATMRSLSTGAARGQTEAYVGGIRRAYAKYAGVRVSLLGYSSRVVAKSAAGGRVVMRAQLRYSVVVSGVRVSRTVSRSISASLARDGGRWRIASVSGL